MESFMKTTKWTISGCAAETYMESCHVTWHRTALPLNTHTALPQNTDAAPQPGGSSWNTAWQKKKFYKSRVRQAKWEIPWNYRLCSWKPQPEVCLRRTLSSHVVLLYIMLCFGFRPPSSPLLSLLRLAAEVSVKIVHASSALVLRGSLTL